MQDYNGVPHGGCHKGVDERQFTSPKKYDASIPSVMKKASIFFKCFVYGMVASKC